MPELKIIFDGVVAIGPGHSSDYSPQPGPLYAVMPRSTRQQNQYSKANGQVDYIPVHFPVIATQLSPYGRKADDCFRDSEGYRNDCPPDQLTPSAVKENPPTPVNPLWYLWYPMRERLEFVFDGDPKPGTLTYHPPVYPNPTGAGPKYYPVSFVADMREVFPARSKLRRKTLSRKRNVVPEVAAQVFVPRGNVASAGEDKKADGVDVIFDPSRAGRTVRKTIVPQVVVTVDVDLVDIVSTSLDTGETLDPMSFKLDEQGGPYEIRVGNADPRDVRIGLHMADYPERLGADPTDHNYSDADFELYYSILRGKDDGKGLPVPTVPSVYGTRNCYTVVVGGSGG